MAAANSTPSLTHSRLLEVLHYEPQTGQFTWIKKPSSLSRVSVGTTAGSVWVRGYVMLKIDNARYLAHRCAWLYMTGEWPKQLIDHIDGDTSNNRWANLREASHAVNAQNRTRSQSRLAKLPLGVSHGHMTATGQSFKWQMDALGVRLSKSGFRSAENAHADYLEAKRMWHTGCTI